MADQKIDKETANDIDLLQDVIGKALKAGAAPAPQTIQILDLSNPASPKVTRRFEGVTAMKKMPSRGVILLANGEGIWILSEHIAEDPAVEQRYARKVVYGESRY